MHLGSSPLARGTRTKHTSQLVIGGLIPARAGNTTYWVPARCETTAHPRSRGEHSERVYVSLLAWGSSPLARGTRFGGGGCFVGVGLIPARAGNTAGASSASGVSRAHPRSRGEHCIRSLCCSGVWGSSPLARGTQGIEVLGQLGHGLIPARAGNTRFRLGCGFGCGAHPRSRGEHRTHRRTESGSAGSSPLARGTPDVSRASQQQHGLIPARAGNTMMWTDWS